MSFKRLSELDLAGKRVLIRADLNVPVKEGKVNTIVIPYDFKGIVNVK